MPQRRGCGRGGQSPGRPDVDMRAKGKFASRAHVDASQINVTEADSMRFSNPPRR